ncbi:MAG: hypothetical protein CMH64_01850 [Nanoarchaeota archaeon]|nr:hypothetical protein [Nanoarchaeota archaeon]|tara:strand:- start:3257 stop:3568 length:312 start_codon:yes stop_codon:yes gene_type:complete
MNLITLLIGAGIFVTFGDLVLAQWARENHLPFLFLGLFLNLIGIVFYANTLKLESIGIATAIFLGINILAVSLGSYFVFNETISLKNTLGMGLIVLSILMIEL